MRPRASRLLRSALEPGLRRMTLGGPLAGMTARSVLSGCAERRLLALLLFDVGAGGVGQSRVLGLHRIDKSHELDLVAEAAFLALRRPDARHLLHELAQNDGGVRGLARLGEGDLDAPDVRVLDGDDIRIGGVLFGTRKPGRPVAESLEAHLAIEIGSGHRLSKRLTGPKRGSG